MVVGHDHSARNDNCVSVQNDVNHDMQSLQKIKQFCFLVKLLLDLKNTLPIKRNADTIHPILSHLEKHIYLHACYRQVCNHRHRTEVSHRNRSQGGVSCYHHTSCPLPTNHTVSGPDVDRSNRRNRYRDSNFVSYSLRWPHFGLVRSNRIRYLDKDPVLYLDGTRVFPVVRIRLCHGPLDLI